MFQHFILLRCIHDFENCLAIIIKLSFIIFCVQIDYFLVAYFSQLSIPSKQLSSFLLPFFCFNHQMVLLLQFGLQFEYGQEKLLLSCPLLVELICSFGSYLTLHQVQSSNYAQFRSWYCISETMSDSRSFKKMSSCCLEQASLQNSRDLLLRFGCLQ